MPKPRCFVGSSAEGLDIARAVQEELEHDAEVTVWSQDVFRLSEITVDSLLRALDTTDFAILVLSPDDVLRIRGEEHRAARDNVVFELGLSIGRLGRQRSFILAPRNTDLHIPTDLVGITPATFDPHRSDRNLVAAVGPACAKVRRAIALLGSVKAVREPLIEDHRAVVLHGVSQVHALLRRCFGPAGTRVSVETNGHPVITRSGRIVCETASIRDPFAREGALAMVRVANQMARQAGDGSKAAVLIAARLIEMGAAAIDAGFERSDVVAGMAEAVDAAQRSISAEAKPLAGRQIEHVATAAAMDPELGAAVAAATERGGPDGIIRVETTGSAERVRITATEGMTFDRGFEHEEFVTDRTTGVALLEDCSVLVFRGRISGLQEILPLLERAAQAHRSLLVVADRIERDALATLVLNHQKGVLRCAAVRAPGYEEWRIALLGDIAVYTGATVVDPDLGMSLRHTSEGALGRARQVRVTKDTTTIIAGAGSEEETVARRAQIRTQIKSAESDYEREKARERLAALCGGVVTILLGGAAEAELDEDRRRLIAGLNATHAAIRSGWVPGGGVAFVRARADIRSALEPVAGRKLGKEAVERALEEPTRTLCSSVGHDESQTLATVERGVPLHVGLNVVTRRLEDLVAAGVLDPAGTLVDAIGVALTSARSVLETDSWVIEEASPSRDA